MQLYMSDLLAQSSDQLSVQASAQPSLQALLQAVDAADSATKLLEAVQDLAAANQVAAIPTLIAALGYNNPGAAVAAVDGLIRLGKPAVQPLLELLDGYNYGARAWALRALSGIGDPRALDLLLEAALHDFALSVRRAAARGLGTIDWDAIPAADLDGIQMRILDALLRVLQDPEWIVRYAAVTGLQELAIAFAIHRTDLAQAILAQFDQRVLSDDSLAVIARIGCAQREIQQYVLDVLATEPSAPVRNLEIDWQTTLEKLYARKRKEAPLAEGDPRRFRQVAAALLA
jgi:phycocyanobilin lyase subunit beta